MIMYPSMLWLVEGYYCLRPVSGGGGVGTIIAGRDVDSVWRPFWWIENKLFSRFGW